MIIYTHPLTNSSYSLTNSSYFIFLILVVQEQAIASPDPTSYYNDFWLYASYYGEAAARVYYTEWSPPIGTVPPAGTVLPGVPAASALPVVSNNNNNNNNTSNNDSSQIYGRKSQTNPQQQIQQQVQQQITPAVDPEIAAAYEEYKIEVS